MDHALAKQLKDAGFPQIGSGKWQFAHSSGFTLKAPYKGDERDLIYHPTLEELIEACGGDFGELERDFDDEPKWIWRAVSDAPYNADGAFHTGEGSTPTESVARLWLALNAKTL
jgi:hypothetical protein